MPLRFPLRSLALWAVLVALGPGAGAAPRVPAPASQPRRAAASRPASQPARPRVVDPAEAARREALRSRIDGILGAKALRRVQSGVEVLDPDGEVIYAHRADTMLKAASNTKLFTTSAAFTLLGDRFQLRTTVAGKAPDDQGVVRGDLYLRGAGDPYLSTADLQSLAKRLRARGVRRVAGAIVADESREGKEPGRGTGGLSLDRSTFNVVVSPGPKVRARPHVSLRPGLSRYFKLVNRAVTVKRGKMRLSVTTRDVGVHTVVTVSGRIPLRHRAVSISRNPRHSSLFVGHSLRAMLEEHGVTVTGGVRTGRAPKGLEVLAEHDSPPLKDMARPINKNSNNFMAERLFQSLGAELFGGPPTSAKGSQAVAAGLSRLGFEKTAGKWNQVDGSGLSHSNRMAPAFLAELLRRMLHSDPKLFASFFHSLAVGGRDGTIAGRFRAGPNGGIVFGKTGTLRDTSALSGYVRAGPRTMIFSVLMNGTRRRTVKAARQAQNEIAMAVYRYMGGDAANVALPEQPNGDVEQEGPGPDEPVFDESREVTDEVPVPARLRLPLPALSGPELAPPRLLPPPGLHGPANGLPPVLNGLPPARNGLPPARNGLPPMRNGHPPVLNGHRPAPQGHAPPPDGHAPALTR